MGEGLAVRTILNIEQMGRRIVVERAKNRLSQAALGEKAGLAQNTISAIERGKGKRLAADVVVALSEALQISLDYLVYGDAGPPWKDGRGADGKDHNG